MIEIQWNPTRKFLRQFAALFILFFGVIGAFRFAASSERTAIILWSIASIGLVGLIAPSLMRYVYLAWMIVVFPIGWLVSTILLSLAFCLVVTPLGVVMRLMGRDPMNRRIEPEADSYWEERPPPPKARTYFKQF